MQRREFLKHSSAAALLACFPASLAGIERSRVPGQLERRSLGRTGERLSMIGFGGIVVMNATTTEASERVAHAIDRGVNYFDVAPSYGNAEEMLGPALEPYRKQVFLACKTQKRDRAGATEELERSLAHMRTDHFDLYQLHAVTKLEEVEQIFAPGGALEAFEAARKAGKVRFLGFSAHSVAAALALIGRFSFDTILFPINFATWHAGNFGPQVLDAAQKKQMGILALKSMARRPWPEGAARTHAKCWYEPLADEAAAREGLRFTLSHPVTAAIPPGDENLFRMALELAAAFQPLGPAEADAIKKKGADTTPLFKA
jgi:aryl-alcohol dehydrogenase-like predicted oxidoreductase